MRVANSDCCGSKEQWHPPGHAKKHGSGVAFDPAVYFKRVKRCAQCCTQQEQPEYCPCPWGYCILRVSHASKASSTPIGIFVLTRCSPGRLLFLYRYMGMRR